MRKEIDCDNCEAKMIIESQSRFIQQLLNVRDIKLSPVVKVGDMVKRDDDYIRLWNVKDALLRKYKKIVAAYKGLSTDEFIDKVSMIIGDDV